MTTKRAGRQQATPETPSMRLSGRTEDELIEQLIWRTVDPDPRDDRRRQALLRWAGVRGPYVTTQEIADEHRVSRQIVSRWITGTITAAPTVDLTPVQLAVLSAPTFPARGRADPGPPCAAAAPCVAARAIRRHNARVATLD